MRRNFPTSRRSHRCGPNGIGMRRGAQYKVLSTIYNILRQVSLIRCTHVGHRFISAFHAYESVCGLAIDRAPHNVHAATAAAHVRVQLAAHVRINPPSVPNASACRAHELLADGRSRRREQLPPMQSSPQDRRSAASERPSGGPASTAATKFMIASVPTSRL